MLNGLFCRLVIACAAALLPLTAAHAQPLPRNVAAALDAARIPRSALVAVVHEVDAVQPRLAVQAQLPVNPASLFKLVTTNAALDLLGPAFTWKTGVWLDGAVRGGVLEGNLVIRGSGDPKLVHERVWLLLRRVQQLGVREIRGDIVLDRSAFSGTWPDPAAFDDEPLRPYNVQPDALLLNYHALTLSFMPDPAAGIARVSSEPALAGLAIDATVPLSATACGDWRDALQADFSDPARVRFAGAYPAVCGERAWPLAPPDAAGYNARMLAGLWHEMGGRLTGTVRDGAAPYAPPAFEFVSPTLAEVVREINKFSNNVMAQQLFLTLGLTQRGQGTAEASRAVLGQWLVERFGAAASGALIDNGSGLSRDQRISAELLAAVLRSAWASPVMSELMSSLPVSGVDGTLRRSKAPAGRAHLKTGSLRDVAGIAGYVLGASGRRYVVVAIVSDPNAGAARPALDALVQWAGADLPGAAKLAE